MKAARIYCLFLIWLGFTASAPLMVHALNDLPDDINVEDSALQYRSKKSCKKLCNLLVKNCLRAGALNVGGDLVINGNLTVNNIVNNNTVSCTLPRGLDGQALIGSTGSDPVFQFLSSPNNSVIFTPGPGSLALKAVPSFGNIARVDQIYGDDATGAVNGSSFLTIQAALTAAGAYASSTTPVVVWVFPGIYNEAITIPSNVTLAGLSSGASADVGGVTIQQLNVSANTTLVTMNANSLIENVVLELTSASNVTLTGVALSTAATLNAIELHVTNSGNGSAPVYGIHLMSAGSTSSVLADSTITVSSAGTQPTYGVLIDTFANFISINDSTVVVSNTGGGNAIGLVTNVAGALLFANASVISGSFADISQNLGKITLIGTMLVHSTANGLGFTSSYSPTTLVWADFTQSTAIAAGTFFLVPGTGAASATVSGVFGYLMPQQAVIRNLYARASRAPGGATTATFTLFKNGVATSLTTSLVGAATSNNDTTHSVVCAAGDVLSMRLVNSAGSNMANISVNVELY